MSDVETQLSEGKKNKETLPSALVHTLVKQCRDCSEDYVHKLFEPLAKQLDDDLFKLAEKTLEFQNAQRYSEAMRTLRSERENFAKQFEQAYSGLLSQALNPGDGLVFDTEGDGLTLIDDAQLEESLVVSQITAKIFEHCSDELYALEQRLSLMLPDLKMDEGDIPFGSAPICDAFVVLLQPLEFDVKVKLAIYRSLERSLLASIGTLFGELNELLRQADILPEIKREVKKSESSLLTTRKIVESVTNQGGGLEIGNGQGTGSGGGSGGHSFHGVQQLAGLLPEGDEAEALISMPVTPQLVEALSGLQISSELLEAGAEISNEELKARIKAQLDGHEGSPSGGISQLDDETIDVISMIFDDLMDDENLPDFIKALIARLQIPVLKVAIIDRLFFSQKEHPVRQLLNALTMAGQTAHMENDDDEKDAGEHSDLIYQKIESVVMRLIHEFQGDPAVFEACLDDFRAFMTQLEADFQHAQQAISETAQQNSFEAKSKKGVAKEIAARLLNHKVPENIKTFLMGTWRQVLLTIMLNDGDESPALQRAEQVCTDLIWIVEPMDSHEEKKKLLLVIPLILDALREGLEVIDYTEAQVREVYLMIEPYYAVNLKDVTSSPSPFLPSESQVPVVDEIDQLLQEMEVELDLPTSERLSGDYLLLNASASSGSGDFEMMMKQMGVEAAQEIDDGPRISDKYSVLVGGLEEGCWVELIDDNGEQRRVKLAWKGDEFSKYAFVNWRYKVVAEKSYYELADEFRRGNASIIEDLPLFDRAFDSVFSKIMQLAS